MHQSEDQLRVVQPARDAVMDKTNSWWCGEAASINPFLIARSHVVSPGNNNSQTAADNRKAHEDKIVTELPRGDFSIRSTQRD